MCATGFTDKIFSAVEEGNVSELRETLSHFNGDINTLKKEETSPLMWAVLHRNPEVVNVILEAGLRVNYGDNWETLHTAVCDRNLQIIQLLLDAGINCNTRDSEGCHHTPLTRAVKLGDLAMLELLVEADCDLDLSGPTGESPLHIALKEGFHDAAVLLLKHGSNPAVEDDFSTNCLERALRASHVISSQLAALLIGQTERRCEGGHIDTACCDKLFFMAIQGGHIEIVKQLLPRGSGERINESNKFDQKFPQYYPLEIAVLSNSKDNPQIVQLLLDSGADPNQQGFTGLYPIHIAASSLNSETLKMLIKAGAKLDSTTCGYYPTALMLAIKLKHDQAAGLLVRHNASTDLLSQTAVELVQSQLEDNEENMTITKDRIELIKLLRLSGSSCHRIAAVLSEYLIQYSASQSSQCDIPSVADLESILRQPLYLKELARVCIRNVIGSRLLFVKDSLPIPPLLRDYLLITEDL